MKKNSFLLTLIATVGAIVFTLIYAVVMTLVARLTFNLSIKDTAAVALRPDTTGYIIAAFIIFEVVFFVWLFTSMAKEKDNKQDAKLLGGRRLEEKKSKMTFTKATKLSLVAASVILLCMIVANAGIYTEVSKDSVKEKSLVTTKEYGWDEVYRYSLSCDETGNLKYTLQMTNGKSFVIFPCSNTSSDKFIEEFGDMLTYAGYVSDTLDSGERKVQKDIVGLEYMKQYYAESDEVWAKINRIVE